MIRSNDVLTQVHLQCACINIAYQKIKFHEYYYFSAENKITICWNSEAERISLVKLHLKLRWWVLLLFFVEIFLEKNILLTNIRNNSFRAAYIRNIITKKEMKKNVDGENVVFYSLILLCKYTYFVKSARWKWNRPH